MEERRSCPACGEMNGDEEAAEAGDSCRACGYDWNGGGKVKSENPLPVGSEAQPSAPAMTGMYVVLAIVALVIWFVLAKGLIKPGSPGSGSSENKTIELQLEKARNLNRKTPMMVDKSTRLDKVVVEERKIVFRSTLVNPEAEKRAREEEFKKQVGQSLVKNYCANEETRMALQLGIVYGHEYFSPQGKLLLTTSITSEDCPGPVK